MLQTCKVYIYLKGEEEGRKSGERRKERRREGRKEKRREEEEEGGEEEEKGRGRRRRRRGVRWLVLLYESIIPATCTYQSISHTTASYGSRPLFLITSSTTLASPSSVPPKLAASAAFLLSFASAYVCSEREGGWGGGRGRGEGGREGEEGDGG